MRMIVDGRGSYFPGDNSLPTLARQMDHDMRSPLTAICSYAECLAWVPDLEPAARERYAEHIATEARRLARLTGNFLILAAPPLCGELQTINLGEAVAEVVHELWDVITARELAVDWQHSGDVLVLWPPAVLRQMLLAAVEASVEAVPIGSAAQLQLRAEGAEGWLVELSSDGGRPCRAQESFAWRAAEVLAQQRGGEASLQTEPTVRLCLRLPQVGRVRHVGADQLLERSA
jgi:hypothetical protein